MADTVDTRLKQAFEGKQSKKKPGTGQVPKVEGPSGTSVLDLRMVYTSASSLTSWWDPKLGSPPLCSSVSLSERLG